MAKGIVRPWLAKAFLIATVISMIWRPDYGMMLFTPPEIVFYYLDVLDDAIFALYILIIVAYTIEFTAQYSNQPKKAPGKHIIISEANLTIDSETIAPFKDVIRAYITAAAKAELSRDGSYPLDTTEDKINYKALFEAAEEADRNRADSFEKIRESCSCGAEDRANCIVWQGIGGR
jgi:hypothetical protein